MKTARQARLWVYRKLTIPSLRKYADKLTADKVTQDPLTAAQLGRVRKEIHRLADRLEAQARKLELKTNTTEGT